MKSLYTETIALTERIHRQYLAVVKAELDRVRIRDINAVQAMILFNIDNDNPTTSELQSRGYYLGSNVSYNVKKLVEAGYLTQRPSPHDKRTMHLCCTDTGFEVCRLLDALFAAHAEKLDVNGLDASKVTATHEALQYLEGFLAAARVSGTGLRGAA